jgi:MSHA biogenesis protein MshQ
MGARSWPKFALACFLAWASAPARAISYDVTSVASNWIASTGHTVISAWASGLGCPDTVGDDSLSAPLDLGFSFRLGATSYTQVRVNTNGRIAFNNSYCTFGTASAANPRTYPNPLPNSNLNNSLQIYGADLDENAAGTITYSTVGTAPNRIFVVTWNDVSAWREGGAQNRGAGTSYNLQIQLHESGDFYFVYGNSDDISEPSNTAMGPAQIGWQIDSNDYALVRSGLPANNTAYRFTLARPYVEYRLDDPLWNGTAGEVADSSGNGRNGSRIDAPVLSPVVQTIASGKICRAMDVPDNGGNAQIDAVNSTVTPNAVGSTGTITFWWRARGAWNGSANYLVDATTQANRFFYIGKRNNSRLRFEVTDNASTPVTLAAETANTGVAANTWAHIAVTWRFVAGSNASTINIYLDGALVATTTGTTNGQLNATLGSLYVGDNRSAASNGLTGSPTSADGTIDEFRVYPRVLTAADVASVIAETRASCPVVGAARFLLSHAPNAINCRVEPITISALDGFSGLVGTYSSIVTLTTQSGRGTWSLISGRGTLVEATPDDGIASYQFNSTDGGQATVGLYYPAGASPIDVEVFQTDDSTIRDDDSDGLLAFGPNGFTVTGSPLTNPPPNPIASPIANQVAGTSFPVYVTAYGQTPTDPQCGVIETYTGVRTLRFWMDYLNPAPGVINATVNAIAVGSNEAAAVSQSVTFALGQATVTAKYKDVGSIRLQMKDPAGLPGEIRGSTNSFVVKPAQLAVSRVETLAGVANPGAATATGAGFVAAGAPFRVEVEARDSEGSITPGYGRESSPEGIRIASSSLIVPAAGRNGSSGAGTLGGATTFAATGTAGRFRNDTVVFDEVGIIRLAASVADADYLGAGAVAAAPSGNVGRFFPARFVLAAGSSITPSCGSFTYMDQAQLGVSYRLEAREGGGNITQNYDTALLGANAVATLSIAAENADSGVDLGARLSGLARPWAAGTASISTMAATFTRNPSPDGPFDALSIGLRAADPLLNTTLLGANMNAATSGDCAVAANCDAVKLGSSTRIRYGRLMVKPSFGPETRDLGVALEAQYFDGSLFARNALDSCTSYSRGAATLSAFSGNLAAGETAVTAPIAATALVAGEANASTPLLLSAPGIGNDGAVDVRLDVAPHLEFDWSGSGATDPTGNARFGRYRGTDRIIFWKEH